MTFQPRVRDFSIGVAAALVTALLVGGAAHALLPADDGLGEVIREGGMAAAFVVVLSIATIVALRPRGSGRHPGS